jgi:hypothetical protein
MRFTIRDLLMLAFIAGASCVVALFLAPSDPVSELIATTMLFVFGMACYVSGIAAGRNRTMSN